VDKEEALEILEEKADKVLVLIDKLKSYIENGE